MVTESPLILTDIITDTEIRGHSMVFTYAPAALNPTAELICNLEALVKGELLVPSKSSKTSPSHSDCLGRNLVGIAFAAIDMALWDALARVAQRFSCAPAAGRKSLFALTVRSAMTVSKVAREPPKAGRREDSRRSKPRSATRPCKRTSPLCGDAKSGRSGNDRANAKSLPRQ